MEIRNIHAINCNITEYLCTQIPIEMAGTLENETENRVLKTPCNLSDLVESLSLHCDFSRKVFHVIFRNLHLIYNLVDNLSVDKFP